MMTFRRSTLVFLSLWLVITMLSAPIQANPAATRAEKNDKVTGNGGVESHAESKNPSLTASSKSTGQANWVLKAEQWELARSGDYVLSLPAVNDVVNAWLKDRQQVIEIQFPGGEEGEFWMQELFDWMVALGVPSANMITTPGSGAVDIIRFGLIK